MDYSGIFHQTLSDLGFDLVAQYNCFDPDYDPQCGWPLKLPDCEFGPRTLVLLHFQDFVTNRQGVILELQRVEQFYRHRSSQVLVTHWPVNLAAHYNGPVNLIAFNSHEHSIIDNVNKHWHRYSHLDSVDRNTQWMCLNGRRCAHRLRTVQALQDLGNGIVSYGNELPLAQWPYSTYPGTENEDNFFRLLEVYGRSKINIVTETQYDHAPGIITEKTFLALIARQIPLIIGYPGIVQDCEDLGFDMFRDLVDTDYDHWPNERRVEQAIQSNRDLLQGRVDLSMYQSRLDRQRQYVLGHWQQCQIQRFRAACKDLAQKLLM